MALQFFELADQAKTKSCDKHTKLGAIIIDINGNVLIESCNTMPTGIKITDERLERPIKYQYIEHAERNACFYASKHGIKLEGTIMCMSCNPIPCTECARAIIQSGIKMIIGRDIENVASKKWDDSCNFALDLLKEADIIIVFINENGKFNVIGNLPETYKQFLVSIGYDN
jgi:dCMP deaminase